jgi:hypothetical protein
MSGALCPAPFPFFFLNNNGLMRKKSSKRILRKNIHERISPAIVVVYRYADLHCDF